VWINGTSFSSSLYVCPSTTPQRKGGKKKEKKKKKGRSKPRNLLSTFYTNLLFTLLSMKKEMGKREGRGEKKRGAVWAS